MRAYFFVNSALSGIQKGLQAAHCVAEMARQSEAKLFAEPGSKASDFTDWAENFKTIVVLEGGFHDDLRWIKSYFEMGFNFKKTGTKDPSPFSWAAFTEDEETMNGMMTCVGIILPERIYEAAKDYRENRLDSFTGFTGWEVEMIKLLNSCPLAR